MLEYNVIFEMLFLFEIKLPVFVKKMVHFLQVQLPIDSLHGETWLLRLS